MESVSWSRVCVFREFEWSCHLQKVGVESGSWSGVGNFRQLHGVESDSWSESSLVSQLEWSWHLQTVGVELASSDSLVCGVGTLRQG